MHRATEQRAVLRCSKFALPVSFVSAISQAAHTANEGMNLMKNYCKFVTRVRSKRNGRSPVLRAERRTIHGERTSSMLRNSAGEIFHTPSSDAEDRAEFMRLFKFAESALRASTRGVAESVSAYITLQGVLSDSMTIWPVSGREH